MSWEMQVRNLIELLRSTLVSATRLARMSSRAPIRDSARLDAALRACACRGERLIASGQIGLILLLSVVWLFIAEHSPSGSAYAVAVFALSCSALRLQGAKAGAINDLRSDALTVADFSIFLLALSLPSEIAILPKEFPLVGMVLLVALRALRLEARPIAVAGALSILAWPLVQSPIVLGVVPAFEAGDVLRIAVLVLLTLVLSVAALQLRAVLANAAHSADYDHAVTVAQTSLRDLIAEKQLAYEAYVRLREAECREEAAVTLRDERQKFLTVLSHELRTPLNGIIGVLDILRTANRERIGELITVAHSSAKSLMEIVCDVLELAELDHAQGVMSVPFDLRRLIGKVGSALDPIAKSKAIILVMDVASNVPAGIAGDPSRTRQVLINLLGNALKYSGRGTVTLHATTVWSIDGAGVLRFEISDNGSGIDADDLPHIFEEFYTAKRQPRCRVQSSGLGLTIVKRAVETMSGHIFCRSQVGEGTVFTVELPITEADCPQEFQEEPDLPTPVLFPTRVLFVEDNEVNAMITLDMLEGTPLQVDRARDGLEAVEMAVASHYDVILMDISMPGIDGVEATRCIRATALHPQKIVALTANALTGDRDRFIANGFDDYLSKPFTKAALLKAVAKALEGNTIAPQAAERGGLDHQAFDSFASDRKPERVTQLLTVFLTELRRHRCEMRDAVKGDISELLNHFHTVRGMAATIGAKHLATLTQPLEEACRAIQRPSDGAIVDFFREMENVETAVTRLLSKREAD